MFFTGAARAVLADSAASDAATASRVRNLVIDLSLVEGWRARIERWLGPAGLWAAASAAILAIPTGFCFLLRSTGVRHGARPRASCRNDRATEPRPYPRSLRQGFAGRTDPG